MQQQLSMFGESISFPRISSPKENWISKQDTNHLVIAFFLGFSSLLMNINVSLHISLFVDFFLCSGFSSLVLPLVLFSSSYVPGSLFFTLVSISFTCCYFACITASCGHFSSNCWFYSPYLCVFSLGVFIPFPSFSSWSIHTRRGHRSHSYSAEGLAKVPHGAFCDVTFLSYLAGHGNDKLSFYFRINTSCSQSFTQGHEM